jgi:CTP:molybdopterin cytidylyltransferase MocA
VDTPEVGPAVVRRLLGHISRTSIARAAYGGVPGHPVMIGQAHVRGVLETLTGDRGAGDYLAAAEVELVECGDLGSGEDIDTPEELAAWQRSSTWGSPPDQRS